MAGFPTYLWLSNIPFHIYAPRFLIHSDDKGYHLIFLTLSSPCLGSY